MVINQAYNEDCLTGMKRIDDKSVDMILCDLPYGTTQNKWDSIIDLDLLRKQYLRIIKENGAIVLTSAQPFTTLLVQTFIDIFRHDLVWDKELSTGHLNANRMPLRRHETILIFYKNLPTYNPQKVFTGRTYHSKFKLTDNVGGSNYGAAKSIDNCKKNANYKYPTSIIQLKKDHNSVVLHPTQKPVALFEWLIKTYSNEGDIILDNCAGSGTTAIACLNLNRNYILFEKEEKYFNIIQERILSHQKNIKWKH